MIACLTGTVLLIAPDHCVLDVHGVGYQVYASARTLSLLPDVGQTATLNTEMIVREDAILLYGFSDLAEQEWFRLLRVVQGVGTRLALAILSVLGPKELVVTLRRNDKKNLIRVPGVGARMAGRIVTELHDRAEKMPVEEDVGSVVEQDEDKVAPTQLEDDALAALQSLHFRRSEALPVIRRVLKEKGGEISLDKLIEISLRALAR